MGQWSDVARRSAAIAAAVVVTFAMTSGSAFAGIDNWKLYSYGSSSCGVVKDPLNFLYEMRLGLVNDALAVTQGSPLNWSADAPASDQWMYNSDPGYGCERNYYNRASGSTSPRYHTRLYQGSWVNSTIQYSTASPMHHDVYALCMPPDKADSFNAGRDYAKSKFESAGYVLVHTYLGNTAAIQQCDGTYVASDGYSYENRGK